MNHPAALGAHPELRPLAERIVELHAKVMTAAGMEFNPDSPKQLAEVLFEKLGLKTGKKTKTGFSTDVQVLEKLANGMPGARLTREAAAALERLAEPKEGL